MSILYDPLMLSPANGNRIFTGQDKTKRILDPTYFQEVYVGSRSCIILKASQPDRTIAAGKLHEAQTVQLTLPRGMYHTEDRTLKTDLDTDAPMVENVYDSSNCQSVLVTLLDRLRESPTEQPYQEFKVQHFCTQNAPAVGRGCGNPGPCYKRLAPVLHKHLDSTNQTKEENQRIYLCGVYAWADVIDKAKDEKLYKYLYNFFEGRRQVHMVACVIPNRTVLWVPIFAKARVAENDKPATEERNQQDRTLRGEMHDKLDKNPDEELSSDGCVYLDGPDFFMSLSHKLEDCPQEQA